MELGNEKTNKTKEDEKVYRKEYYEKNKEVLREKAKLRQRKFRRENPEKVKAITLNYLNNGGMKKRKEWRKKHPYNEILKYLKFREKEKFGVCYINLDLINKVNERDKNCVYCGKELISCKICYDHIDAFKPFSETNIVRCCSKCNESKSNADVLKWCKYKKFEPAPIVIELLNQQKENEK